MRFLLFILITGFISFPLPAQMLKGKIMDEQGEAIPYATVYIEEIASGIVSDDRGAFQSTLEKGAYTLIVSSLGHEKKTVPVTIPAKETTLQIVLKEKIYQLNEVTVHTGGEDPAYPIMRKAAIMAPFYLHQVKSYQADIYLKGTLKVDKIPAFVKRQIKDPRLKHAVNKLFLIESQNEVTYTAPDRYDQKVIALSGSVPVEFDSNRAMRVINSNIYSPTVAGIISPLSPHTFSYYRFRLEGVTFEGEHLINKIQVIPKKKNAQLVKGYIYIVENLWNVQHANLTATQTGVTLQSNIAYHEVRPGIYLPISCDIKADIDLMGVKGEVQYYSSVKYNRIDVNGTYTVTPSETIDKQVAKESGLLVKAQKKSKDKNLEIKPRDSVFRITHDTLSLLRDSAYWREVRKLPLRPDEIISYRIKDSLKHIGDSLQQADSLQNRTFATWIQRLASGENIKLKDKYTIGYSGILNACREYNFADGFRLGQTFNFRVNFSEKRLLSITPSVYYLTARKDMSWQIENSFRYDPLRHGNLTVAAGNRTDDYAGTCGTGRFDNSVSSLFFAENTAKFYQKKFIRVSHQIDLAHALQLTVNISYDNRNTLHNHISYSFFGGRPEINIPDKLIPPMPEHTSFRTGIRLQYTPRYHYRIRRGKKIYLYSNYPTFTLGYEKGIALKEKDASFDKIEASIKQSIRLNAFTRLHYSVDAGFFPSAKTIYLPDYKHFNINELLITSGSLTNRFSLINNYEYVTDNKWVQGDIELASDYLLLKNIRFMQSCLFNESLHLRTLWIPGRNYTEFGYSAGFGHIVRAGVFAGLNNGRYDKIGCTISFPLVQIILNRR